MDGQQQIADMMNRFRLDPPVLINGAQVVALLDFESGVQKDLVSGVTTAIELPCSNVLQFVLSDGSIIAARPSGTEPKIKFYFSVYAPLASSTAYEQVAAALEARINGIVADMKL
jgi:phosphoglucomutase